MDVWAAADTVDLAREAQVFKPNIRSFLVPNRKIANTAIGRDVRKALKELDVPVLRADIDQRVAFAKTAETAETGTTVPDKWLWKAAKEIKKFASERRRIE